jgi:hypothetical protein
MVSTTLKTILESGIPEVRMCGSGRTAYSIAYAQSPRHPGSSRYFETSPEIEHGYAGIATRLIAHRLKAATLLEITRGYPLAINVDPKRTVPQVEPVQLRYTGLMLRTTVIFVHGFTSSPKCWDPFVTRLEQDDDFAGKSYRFTRFQYPTRLLEWKTTRRIPWN